MKNELRYFPRWFCNILHPMEVPRSVYMHICTHPRGLGASMWCILQLEYRDEEGDVKGVLFVAAALFVKV